MTVSRALPARFDVSARAEFPLVARARLAHQIRQDMWRKLQRLRGFCPAVRVTAQPGGVAVLAGGAVEGPITDRARAQVGELLADPALRDRWVRNARKR